MTTASGIESFLGSNVFNHASVTAFTEKVVYYEMAEDSEVEINAISKLQKINFFQCLVRFKEAVEGLTQRRLEFPITFKYTFEKDATNLSYQKTRDGIEALQTRVRAVYPDFNGLIDYMEFNEAPQLISVRIGGQVCWQASFFILAVKAV
jgi:hypothetical protein